LSGEALHNEKQLLLLAAAGDPDAFRLLYDNYRHKVYAFIYHMTGSFAMAEDVVQDVFVQIWERKASLGDIENFNAYLHRLVRNKAIDSLRRLSLEEDIIRERVNRAPAMSAASDERLLYNELRRKLYLAVGKLPEQQRRVYRLSREEGLRQEEIAARLNIAVATVKKHLTLALNFIRKHLDAVAFLIALLIR
jgi:RNA polymerase sigma-70 factor (family 1)